MTPSLHLTNSAPTDGTAVTDVVLSPSRRYWIASPSIFPGPLVPYETMLYIPANSSLEFLPVQVSTALPVFIVSPV